MRSDSPLPSTAGDSIEEEVTRSVALPFCSIQRSGRTQDLRWKGGFSRILEFVSSTRLHFGIAVSSLFYRRVHRSEMIAIFSLIKSIKVMVCFLLPFP